MSHDVSWTSSFTFRIMKLKRKIELKKRDFITNSDIFTIESKFDVQNISEVSFYYVDYLFPFLNHLKPSLLKKMLSWRFYGWIMYFSRTLGTRELPSIKHAIPSRMWLSIQQVITVPDSLAPRVNENWQHKMMFSKLNYSVIDVESLNKSSTMEEQWNRLVSLWQSPEFISWRHTSHIGLILVKDQSQWRLRLNPWNLETLTNILSGSRRSGRISIVKVSSITVLCLIDFISILAANTSVVTSTLNSC